MSKEKYKDSTLRSLIDWFHTDGMSGINVWLDRWIADGDCPPHYYDKRLWGEAFCVMADVLRGLTEHMIMFDEAI